MKSSFAAGISFVLIFILVLSGCKGTGPSDVAPATSDNSAVSISPLGTIAAIEAAVANIYAQVNPSVVNIDVSTRTGGGLGSGFVWDASGHIVTNNHVIDGATSISVTFSDGNTFPGRLIGTDPDSDLAVVKVDNVSSALRPVSLADSTQLKVGQLAVAIGNPFGLQGTMTVGFISALGRLVPVDENAIGPTYNIPDIIQTDAPLNPGNSGGVLLNSQGQVIGVTQSMSSTSGSSAGVGFAVPSAIVKNVIPALITTGRYEHAYLGIVVISLNPDIAAEMGLPSNQRGSLIQSVTVGGPAQRAGLRPSPIPATVNGLDVMIGGDIIIGFHGQTVRTSDDLITMLARIKPGQSITITVLRDGQQIQVPVTIGVRPGA